MNRRGVIWDVNGVLCRYFTETLVELGREAGWPIGRLGLGPTDPAYREMLDGRITESDYLEVIESRLDGEGITIALPGDLIGKVTARTEVLAYVDLLRGRGHRQAILTNDASLWLGADWQQTWHLIDRFDAVVDTATLGVRKPAPESYLVAASRLELPAGSCLFVDDMPHNCRGAEAVGMASVPFDIADPAESLATIEARLG